MAPSKKLLIVLTVCLMGFFGLLFIGAVASVEHKREVAEASAIPMSQWKVTENVNDVKGCTDLGLMIPDEGVPTMTDEEKQQREVQIRDGDTVLAHLSDLPGGKGLLISRAYRCGHR